jgi:predicted permease
MKRRDLPSFPFRIFRWFCKPEWHADIEGDLIEHYDRNVAMYGAGKAYWKLVRDVTRLFRPGIIRSLQFRNKNILSMLRHNIILSFRNFMRYKTSFFINVTGLSTGLACVLLIFLWVNDEVAKDRFHVNSDRLFQVVENVEQNGGVITRESTSGMTAAALKADMPEIEEAITTTWSWPRSAALSVDTRDVKVPCLYADSSFFKMFSFKLIEGKPEDVLQDLSSVVINESVATSLFGSPAAAMGKQLTMDHDKQLHVTGVMANQLPESSAIFEAVMNTELFRKDNTWLNMWGATAPQTFVLLKEGADAATFNDKIADLVTRKTEGQIKHRTPFIRKVTDAYLYNRYENGKLVGGRIEYVRLFSIIAGIILVMACMNFMNLSTARASRRMKEVGIKKTVGANQSSLVLQFLSESTILALLSLCVSVVFVLLLLPQFNLLTGKNLTLNLNSSTWWFIPATAIITGLAAGSYPALYLSRFRPALVLKGKMGSMTMESVARKWLVVFQFTASIVLIVCVLVVFKQIEFVQNQDLGYKKDNVLMFNREGAIFQNPEAFRNELKNIPGVVGVTASSHGMTGHNGGTYMVSWPGKDPENRTEFERVHTSKGFIEMMGIELKEGRSFSEDAKADSLNIVFNETAIKFMGITDPVGKVIDFGKEKRTIIGVVKDFNFESFREPIKPLFIIKDEQAAGNIMVKLEGGKEQETVERIAQFYTSFNPGFPFVYHFLDQDYSRMYTSERRVAKLSGYFAGLAILISCLGLFGLAAFTAERRLKEIGIRKTLGAGNSRIVYLLSEEFLKIMVISLVIAIPLSWFMASTWLENFSYRIQLEWWYFAASGFAALVIAWLAVSFQTLKAARVNPVDCLKME